MEATRKGFAWKSWGKRCFKADFSPGPVGAMKGHPPTPNSLELVFSPMLLHPSSGCRLAAQYGISTASVCRERGAPGLVFAGGRMLLAPGGALVLDCSSVEGLSVPGWYPWGQGEAVAVCARLLCQAGAQDGRRGLLVCKGVTAWDQVVGVRVSVLVPELGGHPSSNCPWSMQVKLGWRRRRRPRSCSGIQQRRHLRPQRGSCRSRSW